MSEERESNNIQAESQNYTNQLWFKIVKTLSHPNGLFFIATLVLLLGMGLQLGGIVVAAPALLVIFGIFSVIALVSAVAWTALWFYQDYHQEAKHDEILRDILQDTFTKSTQLGIQDNDEESSFSDRFQENLAIVECPTGKDFYLKLKRDYKIDSLNNFATLDEASIQKILTTPFYYRMAFLHHCREFCVQHKMALIVGGILLVLLLTGLLILTGGFFAGVPAFVFMGTVFGAVTGFFQAGFMGLGVSAAIFSTHHVVANVFAGILFCLAPLNIISTIKRAVSTIRDWVIFIRNESHLFLAASLKEDHAPTSPVIEMAPISPSKHPQQKQPTEITAKHYPTVPPTVNASTLTVG